ncbi:MAG: cation transporter [Bacteroidales bacterium]|nr:cation transporter [Bacteroidales bacterium]
MSKMSKREKEIYKVIIVGSVVNFLLLIFKFVAGILGNSAAMIADAVHSLSDFITDVVVVAFVRISGKPEDKCHAYGHGKYETLATAVIGIILLFVGLGMLYSAGVTIIDVIGGKPLEAPGMLALVAAILSILLKEILYRYTVYKGKNLDSQVVVANAWHHRSDAFSSVGTFVGICGSVFLGEKWRILDPIAAVVVSVFVIKVAIQLFKPCLDELLEKSLPAEVEDKIIDIILSFPNVSSPHHLRTRRIGNLLAIEVHIRMDGETSLNDSHDTATQIEQRLRQEFGNKTHIGIHMEPIR